MGGSVYWDPCVLVCVRRVCTVCVCVCVRVPYHVAAGGFDRSTATSFSPHAPMRLPSAASNMSTGGIDALPRCVT